MVQLKLGSEAGVEVTAQQSYFRGSYWLIQAHKETTIVYLSYSQAIPEHTVIKLSIRDTFITIP